MTEVTNTANEKISLYCKNATSNKEYHLQLVAEDVLFMVYAQNGPRGGTLTLRKKTPKPTTYALAKKQYDKTMREKLGDGYTTGADGVAYLGTPMEERFSGIVPQLLNAITEAEVAQYLADPAYVLQEKHDGHHKLARQSEEETIGINKKGLVTGLPEPVLTAVQSLGLKAISTLDGELMGSVMVVFDVLEYEGVDLRAQPYSVRLEYLEKIKDILRKSGVDGMYVTYTARTEADKRKLYAALQENGLEGGVFKRLDAPYTPGKPNSGGPQLKRPFTQRDSFIVLSVHATKRSIGLGITNDTGKLVPIGNSLVPTNYDMPLVGDVVDVEYKHVFIGGNVYQPCYKGKRLDVDAAECVTRRLRYKPAPVAGDDTGDDE
jgi:bifunctional non-homologous end joining protein LigD